MPSSWRLLTAVAIAYLVVGIAVAFALRDDAGAVLLVPAALALLGAVLVAVVLVLLVRSESRLDDLRVPEEHRAQALRHPELHAPSWWSAAAAAAACVAVTGAYVSPLLAGLGLGALGAALGVGAAELWRGRRARRAGDDRAEGVALLDRDAVRLARRVRAFARDHAGAAEGDAAGAAASDSADRDAPVDAVLEGLGRYGVKVVLVGADGRVGDLVVRDLARARLVCELAGATVHETFSRGLSARMHNTRYEWERMGATRPGRLERHRRTDAVQTREASQETGPDDEVAPGAAQPSAPAGSR